MSVHGLRGPTSYPTIHVCWAARSRGSDSPSDGEKAVESVMSPIVAGYSPRNLVGLSPERSGPAQATSWVPLCLQEACGSPISNHLGCGMEDARPRGKKPDEQ